MQPYNEDNQPIADPTPFESEGLKKLLEDPRVDHVRVFALKKGDILNIGEYKYRVTKAMSGGRAVIKRTV